MSHAATEPDVTTYHKVRFGFDPERAKVWRVLSRYLQKWIDPQEGLLDLGAGYGEFTRFTAAREKWALDLNPELIAHWDAAVKPIIQQATQTIPIPTASLGTVFASNFFEHFTSEEGLEILSEIRRMLKPGGRFIAVQPNFRLEPGRYFDDYTHKTAYTDDGFAGLLGAAGFRVIHSEPRFTPFTMKSRWPKAEWMIELYLALPYRPLAGQFLVVAEPDCRNGSL